LKDETTRKAPGWVAELVARKDIPAGEEITYRYGPWFEQT